mgnify:CR=1 FL=1
MNPILKNGGNMVSNDGQGTPNANMISAFKQFRQTMSGDPKQKVMDMLNAGQIDQAMLDKAMSYAKMYGGMFR